MIRAPYDGLVRQKIADVGQYVNVGSHLATTFAIDIAEVRLPVTRSDLQYLDLSKLRAGMPLDAVYKHSWGARLSLGGHPSRALRVCSMRILESFIWWPKYPTPTVC